MEIIIIIINKYIFKCNFFTYIIMCIVTDTYVIQVFSDLSHNMSVSISSAAEKTIIDIYCLGV